MAEFESAHAVAEASRLPAPHSSVPYRHHRAVRLARAGALGRAMQALESQPLAPDSLATEEALRLLHPQSDDALPDWLESFSASCPVSLSSAQVVAALLSASRLAGAGPSGQTFEHLRDLFLGGDGLEDFVQLCSRIAAGLTPPSVARLLANSTLIALAKSSGGVRPIAMGECLYRVVCQISPV